MRVFVLCSLAFVLLTHAVTSAELESVKEPFIQHPEAIEPLYCLMVLGEKKQTKIWVVADKSSKEAEGYDVLYLDLDGDGNLTGVDERIAAEKPNHFKLPELIDSKSGIKHTDFSVRISGDSRPTHMLSMRWRGKNKMGGGYPISPDGGYMRFGTSQKSAPVVWFNGDGPFSFQPWYNDKLDIGKETDLKLFLGQIGSGTNSFCAFQEHVLPEGEGVIATLIYEDDDGNVYTTVNNLDLRC